MKRLIVILPLVALSCICLLHMNANKSNPFSFGAVSQTPNRVSKSGFKYEDCIQKESLTSFEVFLRRENRLPDGENLSQIDFQIKKYQRSLDSTIQNLSTIDAHSFLHNEYKRCKSLILSSERTPIQTYYHFKIMESCYEKDKALNESSQNSLAKL
ncbi:MAG: hypothetical protein AAGA43_14855 [Bacteroidota bacterium]